MRPGSPVRSPAAQVKMAHAVWKQPYEPPQALVSVWVALAVYTKAVQVSSQVVTVPITGGPQGIFSRPQATVEQVNTAEVVAVCATRAEADAAVAVHRSLHSQLQADYTVSEHPVGARHEEAAAAPAESKCIGGCGKTLVGGISYCEPCRRTQWANSGWVPESGDE